MGINKYSIAIGENTKKSRLGCSVCLKNNIDTLILNSSSNKLRNGKKLIKNNITNTKYKEYEKNKMIPVIKSKMTECYCNHMEEIKKESLPKLICSKRFKTPNLISIDEDWLNEIKDFRRDNWFDCHSNSVIDLVSAQNIKPSYIFNKYQLNCNHLNDSSFLNHNIECMELRAQKINNMCLDSSTKVKHIIINKKTTKQNSAGKKKNIPSTVYKPWIPPSIIY